MNRGQIRDSVPGVPGLTAWHHRGNKNKLLASVLSHTEPEAGDVFLLFQILLYHQDLRDCSELLKLCFPLREVCEFWGARIRCRDGESLGSGVLKLEQGEELGLLLSHKFFGWERG